MELIPAQADDPSVGDLEGGEAVSKLARELGVGREVLEEGELHG